MRAATEAALDWSVVLGSLAEHARTPMGTHAAATLTLLSLGDIHAAHDAIAEVQWLDERASTMPLDGIADIGARAVRASKGEVLPLAELRETGQTLARLLALGRYLGERDEELPTLAGLSAGILIDAEVVDVLRRAFDETGELSGTTYPFLAELRQRIGDLHHSIRATLQDLLQSESLADLLQDRFVAMRGERYVLPIKAHAKRWDIGIVHDASGTGRTVFVEPHQVVQLNNRLRLAEAERNAEERRILGELSAQVGAIAQDIQTALEATTHLDLAQARYGLTRALSATRPHVGEDGVIRLVQARHPLLALRGVEVVPNDLGLASRTPALVLTGPNTGGKTVALKTIGLCALLVGIGCWVPADEGSRVDRFDEVLADIGDQQTVQGDLSSFSGHLANLRGMLERARPGCLFLLDEIATGTDPGQGAALAQAVLEVLVDRGARLVVTTHYAQLKGLGAADDRFAVAGMEYRDGRPTYRVRPGLIGNSHALAIAASLGLSEEIVARARALMDVGERRLDEALEALDAQRAEVDALLDAARDQAAALDAKALALENREARLAAQRAALEEDVAASFRARLDNAEKVVAAVVADLQRSPDHRRAQAARQTLGALRDLVPPPRPPQADVLPDLAPGDRVRLLAYGNTGQVVSCSGSHAQVRAGTVTVRVPLTGLARLESATTTRPAHRAPAASEAARVPDPEDAVRTPANTFDMRGMRVEEAQNALSAWLDRAVLAHQDVVFLLHGHGTGALKQALRREWLSESAYVARWMPANADQGGDAYTVVVLRD